MSEDCCTNFHALYVILLFYNKGEIMIKKMLMKTFWQKRELPQWCSRHEWKLGHPRTDHCPALCLNREVRKNYHPHLFVWQLINICFDRFSFRYIFNSISKDWPFIRGGHSDSIGPSLSVTKGKLVMNQFRHFLLSSSY